jgi:hypothetical protein
LPSAATACRHCPRVAKLHQPLKKYPDFSSVQADFSPAQAAHRRHI